MTPASRAVALAAIGLSVLLAAGHALVVARPASRWASAVRAGLGPTCHQRPERCLEVAGTPLPACARCTGLHAAGLAGGAAALLARRRASWGLVAIAWAALGADVLAGALVTSWDHPWLRLATGLAAGASILAAGLPHRAMPLDACAAQRAD